MPQFRVLIHGRNFKLKLSEDETARGFWTTRFVEANDAEEAELLAVQMIRDDPFFVGKVMNDKADSPIIDVPENSLVEKDEEIRGPGSGYAFYSVTGDDPPVAERPKSSLLIVVVVSTIAGFIIQGLQGEALGEAPQVMMICGWVLAFATGVLRLGRSFAFGIAAMSGFFITATIDLILNGGHTLLPFEFAIYAFYALTGVVVALVTRLLALAFLGTPKG